MNRTHLLIVSLLVLSPNVAAQSRETNKPGLNKPTATATPAKDPEAERIAQERRAHALSLLVSLGTDAGTFNDQALRARTQARIADALWKSDSDRARTLFRKAWDAAEVADAESQQRMEDDAREQMKSGGGGYVLASPPALRNEVLRLAVKHDTALGDEFLGKLREQKQQAATRKNRVGMDEGDSAVAQRLDIAREMLAAGDMQRALQFAAPVLGLVSTQTIDFLSSLREKNAAIADERYAAMLSIAVASPQTDANTASLLSSYIFTPHLYVQFVGSGGAATSNMGGNGAADVSPALRAAFFRAAGEILMRPIPQGEPNQSSNDGLNKYYVIKRLLPLFEQFAPPEAASGLRTQLDALSSMVTEDQRQRQEESVREGIRPQEPKQSLEQSLLDRVDRVKTSAERDQLYFQLAIFRAGAGDISARDYAGKIDDSELRHSVRAYVDASLAVRAVEKKDAERALEIARTGDITHLQRVWTMSRAARLLTNTDRERALQILDDAATEARRIGASDPDRPRAFLAIANALLPIDRARGWDSVNDAVRAANSAPDFTGEDGQLTFRIITKSSRSINQHATPDFDLAGIFRALALDNYERAVELAQVFEREAPRSHAVIAIAMAILDEKRK